MQPIDESLESLITSQARDGKQGSSKLEGYRKGGSPELRTKPSSHNRWAGHLHEEPPNNFSGDIYSCHSAG